MSKDRVRMVLKFDKEEVANIFKQIWVNSLPQMVVHMNDAVNRQGIPCDLHVEQTKSDEFTFRHQSGNKGVVFVASDDDIGVKFIEYDTIPLRSKYIVQSPNGFLLMIKTGDVDQKLEYLQAAGFGDLRDALDDYEEKVVEQKQKALEAEKKAKEAEEAEVDPELTSEDGKAIMAVNEDEEEFTAVDSDIVADQVDTPDETPQE